MTWLSLPPVLVSPESKPQYWPAHEPQDCAVLGRVVMQVAWQERMEGILGAGLCQDPQPRPKDPGAGCQSLLGTSQRTL